MSPVYWGDLMKIQWLAEYRCGCTEVQDRKRDLVGYCGVHGDSARRVMKIPVEGKPLEKGLAK